MSRVAMAKLGLGMGGAVLFLWGAGFEHGWARWTGIGLLVAAWLLRLIERGERHPKRQGPSI